MRLHTISLSFIKFCFSISLIVPLNCFAHLISITATTPFPASVDVSSVHQAIFTVKNITSRVTLIPVNQSFFPPGSGLSTLSTTCGRPIRPGQTCDIVLRFQAPSVPQLISGAVQVWAKPSADGVRYPFTIAVVRSPISQFTITPSATTGGTISPNSVQIVNSGGSLTFTATPIGGYFINQWLLDGILVQSGGTTYTLNNITANHTVQVTFSNGLIAVGSYTNAITQVPLLFQSTTSGLTWSPIDTTLPPDFNANGTLAATACTGINCISAGIYNGVYLGNNVNKPLLLSSSNAGSSWTFVPTPLPLDFVSSATIKAATCEATNICVAVGAYSNGTVVKALILVSHDAGATWVAANPILPLNFQDLASLNAVTCLGTTCVAAGQYTRPAIPPEPPGSVQVPLIIVSNDSGVTWASVTPTLPPTYNNNGTINSVTCDGSVCISTGAFSEAGFSFRPLILVSNDLGLTWGFVTPNLPGDFVNFGFFNAVTCSGGICNGSGNYSDGTITKPLLLRSTNSGASWFPVTTTLPANFNDSTSLRSINCTGSICITAGDYTDVSFVQFPMLLISTNQGASWTAAPITVPAGSDFATLNSLTCKGGICVAVGNYTTAGGTQLPLIYVSSDAGLNWVMSTPTLPIGFQNDGILNSTTGSL